MTAEQKKAYFREYNKKNREKRKQYKKDSAIREVIAEIAAGRLEVVKKSVIREV